MTTRVTRRQALLGTGLGLLYPIVHSDASTPEPKPSAVFSHGVASGDPDQSSVVIWTRVSGSRESVTALWRVSTDRLFRHIVASGTLQTDGSRDHTIKVVVDGLDPGQRYFYRFESGGETSPTGRTGTLPAGHVDNLVIAVATCSNYAFGYFNAYEVIANDPDVDLVLHLGDYIYEHGADGYGGATGSRIGRAHDPSHETITLADYRTRHAQYKSDPGSLAMHARHPLVVIWDDHESANNPWMHGAENHQKEEGDWVARRRASLQAYYEWLPVREPAVGESRQDYWRHFKFGDLVSIITLESRHTGRSQQIDYDDYLNDLDTIEQAEEFRTSVLGDPGRTMLSSRMERFLAEELQESVHADRRWRLIGNQSLMARSTSPKLDDPFFKALERTLNPAGRRKLESLTRLGELNLPDDLDTWEGYPVARERFYKVAKDAGASDLLVVSGDSHSWWANQLFDDDGRSMGLELGASGISAPRSLLALGPEGLKHFDELNAATNNEIVWSDGRHRGFIRLDIDHERIHADFIAVSDVETRQYSVRTIRSRDIIASGDTLVFS